MYSFYLDQQEEIDILNNILTEGSGCLISERAKQYHIPLEIARKCTKEKIPKELTQYVQKAYFEKEKELEKALTFHKDFWHKNGNKCKEMLTRLMEQEIPEFRVRLQVLCDGISDWEGTNVAVNAFEYLNGNPVWYSGLIWETVLALTFVRIRKKYASEFYSDETVWAVSEMTSCTIINTDFNVDWTIGYRQLAPYQKDVISLYKNRKNFSDFLENMLDFFKNKKIEF